MSGSNSRPANGKLWQMYEKLKSGELSRRDFMQRAIALGVAAPVATFVVNSLGMGSALAAPSGVVNAVATSYQDVTARPQAPAEQQRGAGGELKILQWQAPTTLSLHNSQGTKDQLAAALVTEPLMSYLPDGTLAPTLVKEVPSVENGGLSADLTTITYHLLEGVLWSDGTPFTSGDVVATYNWVMEPKNAAVSTALFSPIATIEAPDDLTVVITLKAGNLAWYNSFSGGFYGVVYPKHIIDQGEAAKEIFRTAPIGTGPYKVDSFSENDQVIYSINENYREANKPYFSSINLKGGGDATSAARAVLETGDWNVAWNLQVEPAVMNGMIGNGNGQWIVVPGTSVERIDLNFSDPNKEVDGQRSQKDTPHPFLSDLAVRQALNLATDRDTIAAQFYSGPPGEPGTPDILVGIPAFDSPNTSFEFNIDKANQILDEAGWTKDGDTRKKGDIELKIAYSTTINPVRQKTQAVVKQGWEAIGVEVDLGQIDAGIFFDSAAGNDQNLAHFYNDVMMYTNNASSPYPMLYMSGYYAGPNGSNINQKENDWSPGNYNRFSNAEFDAIYESLAAETDPEAAAASFIRLNDILIENIATIPLVQRAAESFAITNNINPANIAGSSWECLYWNIANWNEVTQ
ncbi:peptide ABC transporter substrate-binding protein [soil metagenome]